MLESTLNEEITPSSDVAQSATERYTCGGLFAGIGGFCVGFENAGFETSWCVDLSEDAEATYRQNFPHVRYLRRDIAKCASTDLSPVDVLHAGFPCQSFSAAGYRQGFEDERGKLFFNIPRLLAEWGSERPKVIVLENSPFIKVGEGGAWFKEIQTRIRRSGYWFSDRNCFELDTHQHGGLPQRRKRLFMIAVRSDFYDFNGIDLSDITPKQIVKMSEIIESEQVTESYYLPEDNRYNTMIGKQVRRNDPNQLYQLRKYVVRLPESGMCPTLTANMGQGGHNVPFIFNADRLRKLTEFECLKLQGFPPSFEFPTDLTLARRYTLVGNAVSPAISTLIATRINNFLRSETP